MNRDRGTAGLGESHELSVKDFAAQAKISMGPRPMMPNRPTQRYMLVKTDLKKMWLKINDLAVTRRGQVELEEL